MFHAGYVTLSLIQHMVPTTALCKAPCDFNVLGISHRMVNGEQSFEKNVKKAKRQRIIKVRSPKKLKLRVNEKAGRDLVEEIVSVVKKGTEAKKSEAETEVEIAVEIERGERAEVKRGGAAVGTEGAEVRADEAGVVIGIGEGAQGNEDVAEVEIEIDGAGAGIEVDVAEVRIETESGEGVAAEAEVVTGKDEAEVATGKDEAEVVTGKDKAEVVNAVVVEADLVVKVVRKATETVSNQTGQKRRWSKAEKGKITGKRRGKVAVRRWSMVVRRCMERWKIKR